MTWALVAYLALRFVCAAWNQIVWPGSVDTWALVRLIRRVPTESPYMVRVQLLRSPVLDVYVNWIRCADRDPFPHNHPWRASWSVKLWRAYVEEVFSGFRLGDSLLRIPPRFSRIPRVHRVVSVSPGGAWTLFVGYRRVKSWGFFDLDNGGKFIPFQKRKAERV